MGVRIGGIATIGLTLALAASAEADPYDDPVVELGASAGLFLPSDSHELYDPVDGEHAGLDTVGPDLGVRASVLPLPFLGVELEGQLIPIGVEVDERATVVALRGHVIGQVPLAGPVTPFAVAGGGWLMSSSSSLGDDTDAVGYLGAGAKLHPTQRIVLRFDARLIRAPRFELMPEGKGTNHVELMFGIGWRLGTHSAPVLPPPPLDADGDGIDDAADMCPTEAGTLPDGCPPRDTDGDGKLDADDRCPERAETVNDYEDDDGCPDEIPDSDGDGMNDSDDLCVEQAEDLDGHEDADGCPDPDNDDDGVLDESDNCPVEEGPIENRGCPDTDRDGDGVVDRIDNCPDEPGSEANFGCKTKQLVQISQTRLEILDSVYFASGKARVRPRSRRLLNNVAAVLNAHPEIESLAIEGHTDARGDELFNQELSQRRAEAVRDYLIGKGVASERIEAVGFGETRPIADNETRAGQEQNRRVEFNIVAK